MYERMVVSSVSQIDAGREASRHWHGVDVAAIERPSDRGLSAVRVHLRIGPRVVAPNSQVVTGERHAGAGRREPRREVRWDAVGERHITQLHEIRLVYVDGARIDARTGQIDRQL